jgi:hypothetical protein
MVSATEDMQRSLSYYRSLKYQRSTAETRCSVTPY